MDFITGLASILLIVLGFGILIFVHELGHFLAAKWSNIRTEAFAIGFGQPIISWRKGIGWTLGSTTSRVKQKTGLDPRQLSDQALVDHGIGETEYSIRWLPLGGFVRMLGQDDLAPASSSTEERSFNQTAIWKRMIVVSAGVIMNLIFAAILFVIVFSIGVRFEAPTIGVVQVGSPASLAVGVGEAEGMIGLQPDDSIVELDGRVVPTFLDATIGVAMARPDEPIEVIVERPDHDSLLPFMVTPVKNEAAGVLAIGVAPASSTTLAGSDSSEAYEVVASILETTGLWSQGLRPGMSVIEVDGKPIDSYAQFQSSMDRASSEAVVTRWRDGSGVVDVSMKPSPAWPVLRPADSREIVEGLLGLVPLVQINGMTEGNPNKGVLEPGDVILRAGDVQAPRRSQFLRVIADHGPGSIDITVIREGKRKSVQAEIQAIGLLKPEPRLGISVGQAWDVPYVAQPITAIDCDVRNEGKLEKIDTQVSKAGIVPGSRIVSVEGKSIENWDDFFEAVASNTGDEVVIDFENPTPGREIRSIRVSLAGDECSGLVDMTYEAELPGGIFDPVYTIRSSGGNPITAIEMGVNETITFMIQTYLTLDRLFRGSVGVEQLQGPVGIVHLGSRIVDKGFTFLLFFLALISVNLAVVNFLPLPIVDGGLFLNLVYEKIKGRPPSPGFQNAAALVGLLLIGTVFIMVTYNDLVRILG
ncbi:MAG: hypothetical protein CMJ40_04415 [Phycisphaerae bacterium]|nr:hypothetical protein [Phycisphaerae bacterium]